MQPGLVGLAVGIVDADCVKARGLRGFQGVETILKDERFRRRGVQGLGGQQVNCRLMLADADLCRSEKPGEIPEQPQPFQRPRDMLPRAGRGRRQLHAAGSQGGQQCRRAVLGGDLIKIEVPQHVRNARADLGGRLRQCIVRVQILRTLLHAHREQNLVESLLRRDA